MFEESWMSESNGIWDIYFSVINMCHLMGHLMDVIIQQTT